MKSKKLNHIHYKFQKGTKPAILFLHGWGSNHSIWTPYFDRFSNHTIIAPDFRGHGNSKEQETSITHLINDVTDILNHEGIKSVHVVGHSLGAAVGLELARLRRLKSLTTMNLYSRRYVFGKSLIRAAINLGSSLITKIRKTEFQNYYHKDGKPIQNTLSLDLKGTSKRTLVDSYDIIHDYSIDWRTNCPTLLIQGTYDPLAMNQRLRNDTKNKKHINLKFIPSHHCIATHNPNKAMDLLEEVWK